MLRAAIVIACLSLTTSALAEQQRKATPRAADKQNSAERPSSGKAQKALPGRDPTVLCCSRPEWPRGGLIHPVF